MKETARDLIGADAMTSGGAYGADLMKCMCGTTSTAWTFTSIFWMGWVEDIDLGGLLHIPDEDDDSE